MTGRLVTLVLCTRADGVLGATPTVTIADPNWQDVEPVVATARAAFGIEVTVLRLLSASESGAVAYLVEVDRGPDVALLPWTGRDPLGDDPHRAAYARPGGPAEVLDWADSALDAIGRPRTGPAQQVRTWNLSALWRLPTAGGTTWLKALPDFLAREPEIVARIGAGIGPPVIAAANGRLLMDDVPGTDQYGSTGPRLLEFARLLIDRQAEWVGRGGELIGVGASDWRRAALIARIGAAVAAHRHGLSPAQRRTVNNLVDDLPARLDDLESCGLPDTLVHGDFHRGNVRGRPGRWVILDWSEAGVGPPLFDQIVFTAGLSASDRRAVESEWARQWRRHLPGCEPERAAELMRPLAALMHVAVYDEFLADVEPDERVYHRDDPLAHLRMVADG